ncbi:MAG: tetratricopeptide repeat protein [Caldilineaceae bacterium]
MNNSTFGSHKAHFNNGVRHRWFSRYHMIVLLVIGVCALALLWRIRSNDQIQLSTANDCEHSHVCIVVENTAQDNQVITQIAQSLHRRLTESFALIEDAEKVLVYISLVNVTSDIEPEISLEQVQENALNRKADLAILVSMRPADDNQGFVDFQIADLTNSDNRGLTRPERVRTFLYNDFFQRVDCGTCDRVSPAMEQSANMIADTVAGMAMFSKGYSAQAAQTLLSALYCSGEEVSYLFAPAIGSPESRTGTGVDVSTQLNLARQTPTCTPAKTVDWNPAPLYYFAAKALALDGYYEDAIRLFERAIALEPNEPANWISLGQTHLAWTRQPDAEVVRSSLTAAEDSLSLLEPLVASNEKGMWHYDLGLVAELRGDLNAAKQSFAYALRDAEINQVDTYEILFALARIQVRLGDTDSAYSLMEQAIDTYPQSPWPHLTMAKLTQGEQAVAEQHLDAAKSLAPNESYVYLTQAELCQVWNATECAETAYQQAIASRPESGWLYEKMGDFYLDTATRSPDLFGAYLDKAVASYRKSAFELRPNDPWTYEKLAYALMNQGKYDDAVGYYRRAIELSNANYVEPRLFCNLSLALEQNGQTEAAQSSQQQCDALSMHNDAADLTLISVGE